MIFTTAYRQIMGLPPVEGLVGSDDGVRVEVYRSLAEAEPFLLDLALRVEPWTFDIETYDAARFPSRRDVATDPCHPDFRVRGCAFALTKDRGAWVDFDGLPHVASATVGIDALRAAFASDAEKGAFNGGFDENGLVYPGWVPEVRNRARDGMLAMVGLGDGTHEKLTLAHAVVALLGHETYWDEDKGTMRELPVEVVARGAVRDACRTHELCDLLDAMAAEGRRVEWSRIKGKWPVVQPGERGALNPEVAGSRPAGPTNNDDEEDPPF